MINYKIFIKRTITLSILIASLFIASSCIQDKLFFYPEKLASDFNFNFHNAYEEYSIAVEEDINLNGLLFRAENSKGLVFYLHGNAGSLKSWGTIADDYLENNYDVFILDYRGFGKSDGKITSESDIYNDIQIVYDSIKTMYSEENIVVIGNSIGTGPATYLSSKNNPKLLILQAPYYNMADLVRKKFKVVPGFLLKYKFTTNKFITYVKSPVIIFHGDADEVIYLGSSIKLKELFKPGDKLIVLNDQGHNGINSNPEYRKEIKVLLN